MTIKPSSKSAEKLLLMLDAESRFTYAEIEDELGSTDCPEGCYVEPDDYCSHGFMSAGLTAGII